MSLPRCGCISDGHDGGYINDGMCLYPAGVSAAELLESRLKEAEVIISALVLGSSWSGSPAIQQAEEWLRGKV